jgi:hypothetical protein
VARVSKTYLTELIREVLSEKKADRCLRIARTKYDKPSAYRSGAIVRCRQGEIWKDLKENVTSDIEIKKSLSQALIGYVWDRLAKQGIRNADDIIGTTDTIDNVDFDKFWSNVTKEDLQNLKNSYETQKQYHLDLYNKFKGAFDPSTGTITSSDTSFFDNKIKNIDNLLSTYLTEDESLHKWFNRQGAKGKSKGWVDCNAPDGKGGYKSCGRQEGEKRSKYPACRPTPSQCKTKGKGKTWGKTK